MKSKRNIWVLGALAVLTAAGCGRTVSDQPEQSADASAGAPPTIAAALEELQQLPVPDGADPETFSQIKSSLATMLRAKATTRKSTSALFAAVTDLHVLSGATAEEELDWTYVSVGDFDQNGEVTVADISPLGLHIGKNTNSPDWYLARSADGDGNGEVNLADLSSVGQNFGGRLDGYIVEQAEEAGADFSEIGRATLADNSSIPKNLAERRFNFNAGRVPIGTQFRVRPYLGTVSGPESNIATYEAAAPSLGAVYPTSGKLGETLQLNVDITGSIPTTYSWVLTGGISPHSSSSASPSVHLDSAGTFACSLTVSNQYGEDSTSFNIVVSDNQLPVAKIGASPGTTSLGAMVLNASASSDADGQIVKYEWDFTGDNKYDLETGSTSSTTTVYSPGPHTAKVRVTDNDGGKDTAEITFTVQDQNNPPDISMQVTPDQVRSPYYVLFDASKSSDSDGQIVKYEWDPYGLGDFEVLNLTQPVFEFMFDAPPGNYEAMLRITDNGGRTATETHLLTVTSVFFTAPPSDYFVDGSNATDPLATKWLKNCYKPMGIWQDPNGCYQSAYFKVWASSVLSLVNAARAQQGLAALQAEPHLDLVVQAHCRDMALNQFFSHTNQYGMDFGARLDAIDPPVYNTYGEVLNAGAGYTNGQNQPDVDGPNQVLSAWLNSPAHKAILMKPGYQFAGVGIYYYPGDSYRCYWGMLFAGSPSQDPFSHDYIDPAEVQ